MVQCINFGTILYAIMEVTHLNFAEQANILDTDMVFPCS